ncbi:MAG: HNH endonuclease [Rickettsia endosymbiont of Sceptobius lativentris]|nr:HNH endonuclease [Rickettsia endosymbiont of Sceptobius lativentris]
MYNESGKLIKEKGWDYDAHHLIKVDHGGPNTWWNIHPATTKEHQQIHGKGSLAKEIFGK